MHPFRSRLLLILAALALAGIAAFFAAACGRPARADYRFLAERPDFDPDLLPVSPAEGDTVGSDAPGFNWQPEEGAAGFILELSRDPFFREGEELLAQARGEGAWPPRR